jgi:3-oxoadipate enol-lactonase
VRGVAHRVELAGVGQVYDAYGVAAAPPMVLLHALGEGRQDWPGIADRLAEDFQVFAVDLRGHGDSDWPGAYSCRLMAEDVARLLDHLELTAVTLLGHSLGGVVAYLLAGQRPDLVARLITEDICPPFQRDRPALERPEMELPFDWAAVLALRSEAEQDDADLWDRLHTIAAPTLLIGGGPDSPVPAEKLRAVAERIPVCELVEIPAGHYVHRSRPEEFLAAVRGWLERTPH